MEAYKYVDEVVEVSDLEEVTARLNDGYILLRAFTTTAYNGDNNETMYYALGHINPKRGLNFQ